jgi:hypothetical protein
VVALEDAGAGANGHAARLDTAGRYEVPRLRPGRYQALLILDGGDRPRPAPEPAIVREGEVTILDFDLGPRVILTGVVRRGAMPLAGVSLLFTHAESAGALADLGAVRTATDGRYEIGLARAGAYDVQVERSSGFSAAGSALARIEVPDEPRVTRDIVLPAGAIEGQVLDGEGQPIAGAGVSARAVAPARAAGEGNARTDVRGHYLMDGLDSGVYRVIASAPGYQLGVLEGVDVGESATGGVDFTLLRGSAVRGRVVDPHGQGLAGALVLAAPAGIGPGSPATSTQTAADGAFQFAAPSEGPLDVTAIAGGWAPALLHDVLPGAPEAAAGWLLRVERGGVLRVRVADREGRPQPGVQVEVTALPAFLGSELALMLSPPLPTDDGGETQVDALAPGQYQIRVVSREDAPPVLASVIAGGVTPVEFRLPSDPALQE